MSKLNDLYIWKLSSEISDTSYYIKKPNKAIIEKELGYRDFHYDLRKIKVINNN